MPPGVGFVCVTVSGGGGQAPALKPGVGIGGTLFADHGEGPTCRECIECMCGFWRIPCCCKGQPGLTSTCAQGLGPGGDGPSIRESEPEDPELASEPDSQLEQTLSVLASLSDPESESSSRSRSPCRARELLDVRFEDSVFLLLRFDADLAAPKPLRATCWSTACADFLCSSSSAASSVPADPLSTEARRFPPPRSRRTWTVQSVPVASSWDTTSNSTRGPKYVWQLPEREIFL